MIEVDNSSRTDTYPVQIASDGVTLDGELSLPVEAQAIVLFAHGSGSSRHSPRNRYVAGLLNQAGFATLLFDLLTAEEETIDQRTRELRFNINLLTRRLIGATDWVSEFSETLGMPVGYFGASTGGAAALTAAGERADLVRAVVVRGGRPDLAMPFLARVTAATLLIVGGNDQLVLQLNRSAFDQLRGERQLAIVPGAGHLFEEPGALDRVASLAINWFSRYLR